MKIALLLIVLLASLCSAQYQAQSKRSVIDLCWYGNSDTSCVYILYYRPFYGSDTTWRLLTTTKNQSISLSRNGLNKYVVFGVRAAVRGDTSDMHSSLDSTACQVEGATCDSCPQQGGWYVNFRTLPPIWFKAHTKK
jgi:hypothetical protein